MINQKMVRRWRNRMSRTMRMRMMATNLRRLAVE